MHADKLSRWMHDHVFDTGNSAAERSTRVVMWITAATMVVEIAAGWWFNSMALLADGWHMSSHAVAIGLSALAYATARRYARDPRFAFGTWKIEILGGFSSAIFLLGVAVMMVVGSVERILSPQPIQYLEAIAIAILGLLVNLVCALILGKAHHHDHGHSHGHGHEHGHDHHDHHHDLNLKSAYLHVITDAATSVLAIVALFGGWLYGWAWLDPLMGIVGAVLVAVWARGLIVDTGKVLLDREMDHPVVDEIREVVETASDAGATRIADLHVWRVGKQVYSCAMTVVTQDATLTPDDVRERLSVHEEIVHSTIEIHHCPELSAGASA
ncbi:CDF family Co(II)/Ni(II) efflux transporter DmeF [Pseudomonas sp. A-1]|jgi:cation diffusion facilitator family transporter|uniref:CDF family Co(II)/Ni(II) efflux transporter DmeF n=1 Tax=Pseudomonas sp. A-1 TaxID=1821274 RepID=UPI0010A62ABD|nr:CDF family Co(II)/Ni(II) efflux transporter DmeF [Pseudomonas sp. A-1]THG78392.1 CDF family Co(II)/Ni(II) efflux transporter DmeF [Pseudomonas sp. A-1]